MNTKSQVTSPNACTFMQLSLRCCSCFQSGSYVSPSAFCPLYSLIVLLPYTVLPETFELIEAQTQEELNSLSSKVGTGSKLDNERSQNQGTNKIRGRHKRTAGSQMTAFYHNYLKGLSSPIFVWR